MYSKAQSPEKRDGSSHTTSLYETYGRSIFSYLKTKGLALQDAEDLLTEVFLAAIAENNLSTLSPERQLLWLKRVAHNKLLNHYRRQTRHPQVPLDTIIEMKTEEKGPEQIALHQEEHRQLRSHIQQLPTLQQQILQLRYSDELPYKEIALLVNKREGTVRKHLSRAILFLRRTYQGAEGEYTW